MDKEAVERVARASYMATPHNKSFDLLSAVQREARAAEARAAIAEVMAILSEPTEEMRKAWNTHNRNSGSYFTADYFRAALAASPLSQGGQT